MNTDTDTHPHNEPAHPPIDIRAIEREARRAERLHHLRELRLMGMEIAGRLNDYMAARSDYPESHAFINIKDPSASFNNVCWEMRRLSALENRFDEDEETRAARIGAEKAEAERKRIAELARLARQPEEEKKNLVRKAVTLAHRDAFPDTDRFERENLLNDLFSDYDMIGNWNRPPIDLVAGFCQDFAIDPDAELEDIPFFEDGTDDDGADPGERLATRCRDWARSCLDWFAECEATLAADPPASPALTHGPPSRH